MNLEKALSRRDILKLGVVSLGGLVLARCGGDATVNVPDDITIDPKHVGMVRGNVFRSEVIENEIIRRGTSGIVVALKDQDRKRQYDMETLAEGAYAFDNIPAGAYSVLTTGSQSWDEAPAIVEPQKTTEVRDLELVKYPILTGQISFQNGNPFANKSIALWGERTGEFAWTTTSPSGTYAFDRTNRRGLGDWYPTDLAIKSESTKLYWVNNGQEVMAIPTPPPWSIQARNLYIPQ